MGKIITPCAEHPSCCCSELTVAADDSDLQSGAMSAAPERDLATELIFAVRSGGRDAPSPR